MCQVIFINKGETEIETVKEFEEYFNVKSFPNKLYNEVIPDLCLCQIDIEKTFKEEGVSWELEYGDYYIRS